MPVCLCLWSLSGHMKHLPPWLATSGWERGPGRDWEGQGKAGGDWHEKGWGQDQPSNAHGGSQVVQGNVTQEEGHGIVKARVPAETGSCFSLLQPFVYTA